MNLRETKRKVGERIAKARESQGLSQRRFSLMTGLDRVTLSRIESGFGNPTIETLQRIADGLNVDVVELFGASDARNPSL